MADHLTPEEREYCESHVRARNIKPETLVKDYLLEHGYTPIMHCRQLPGTPDITLSEFHTVFFIKGCFWHGHEGCPAAKLPLTDQDYWISNIRHYQIMDQKKKARLEEMGWKVIELWECEVKGPGFEQTMEKITKSL